MVAKNSSGIQGLAKYRSQKQYSAAEWGKGKNQWEKTKHVTNLKASYCLAHPVPAGWPALTGRTIISNVHLAKSFPDLGYHFWLQTPETTGCAVNPPLDTAPAAPLYSPSI